MMRLFFLVIFATSSSLAADLSFSQAYQKILDLSLRTETQKFNVDIAKAQHLKPLGQFTPQLNIVGKDVQGGDPRYTEHLINLSATMNIFRFGADGLEYKSTNLNTKSQEEKLLSEKLGSENDALVALFTLIRLATSLDVYQGITNNRAELVRIADERYRKGLLALQEVEKLRVDYENAKAREADTFNELKDSEAALNAQLGFSWFSKAWPWTDAIKNKGASFAQEFKLENLPLYRSARLYEESTQNYARAQIRKRLPSLDLNFTYGTTDLTSGLPSTSANYYIGSLALTIPLLDQLNSYSNYKQAEGFAGQASAQKEFLIRELKPQFETAQKKFLNSVDATLRREKNLSTSRKLYDDNFSRFKQGRVTVNDLLIDQTRLSDAELLAIEALYNLHLNFERLCHANGMSVSSDASCVR